jgi:hypothetical protein
MVACAAPFHLAELWPLAVMCLTALSVYRHKVVAIMKHITRGIPILLVLLSGCGHLAWKTTFVTAAATKEVVTSAHKHAWSVPFNKRVDKCSVLAEQYQYTVKMFERCMGEYAHNDKVLVALQAYAVAAEGLSAILVATDPMSPELDRAALRAELVDLVEAAVALVELYPEGKVYLDRINLLTKGIL